MCNWPRSRHQSTNSSLCKIAKLDVIGSMLLQIWSNGALIQTNITEYTITRGAQSYLVEQV